MSSIEIRLAAAGLPPLPRTAWLQIDLDALRGNLAALRALAGDGVPVHPVVKADAYGHGAVPVALALEAAGADGFCVAAMDEALALRAGGVRAPVRVLYPSPSSFAAEAARQGIAISAGDARLLEALLAAAAGTRSGTDAQPPLGIELQVETGLGRDGFAPDDVVAAARAIAASPGARLAGLWTHLQATEDPERTRDQLARFDAAAASVRAAGLPLPDRHVAASGGLFTDVAALDGVRPGLAVYGVVPDELDATDVAPADAAPFRPVMSLHARPVRVADLPAGQGISYGPTFTTARPSRIATLPLGYGDGFSRAFSNRAEALVRGVRVPLVGNVAMDAIMIDVTDVPGPPVTPDDEFVLLGSQGEQRISVEDLARLRTTNTWEVMSQMAGRLPRVYDAAAGPVGLRTLTER
ncbi:MAG: alanine racemase [Chloroflexota bacterium]|nr:alanine racemase [Chloroflexota bacterium]